MKTIKKIVSYVLFGVGTTLFAFAYILSKFEVILNVSK